MKKPPELRVVRTSRDADKDYFLKLHKLLDEIYKIATSQRMWTWNQLADKANLSHETVIRLGERDTKYPHLRTVLRLAEAVGMRVALIPVSSRNRRKKAS